MAVCFPMTNPSLPSHQIQLTRHRKSCLSQIALHERSTFQLRQSATAFSAVPILANDAESSLRLAHRWREIQGCNDWEGLIDPLDPLLQGEIIRYGELVMGCYKAFDLDPASKRYLNCKYGKKNLLREVGMEGCGYEVTKYIYATPNIDIPVPNGTCCGHWIGYVAVSSDGEVERLGRRDIVVTFRGTITNGEWIANLMSSLTPARLDPHNQRLDVMVESGFLNLYTSDDNCRFSHRNCREQLLSEVSRIICKYKNEKVSLTLAGHSMGSSLALLSAYDIAELGLNTIGSNQEIPVTVYSFGGPRVGNSVFKDRCKELGVKVLRIVNVNDPITKLPGIFLNENVRVLEERYELPWCYSFYAHVGVELALDFFKIQNPSSVHDLGTYISLLRCPKREQDEKDRPDFLNMVREFLSAQKVDTRLKKLAAADGTNLVESIRKMIYILLLWHCIVVLSM